MAGDELDPKILSQELTALLNDAVTLLHLYGQRVLTPEVLLLEGIDFDIDVVGDMTGARGMIQFNQVRMELEFIRVANSIFKLEPDLLTRSQFIAGMAHANG